MGQRQKLRAVGVPRVDFNSFLVKHHRSVAYEANVNCDEIDELGDGDSLGLNRLGCWGQTVGQTVILLL